ncbi:protein of unknown function DUF1735 [Fibrella aestuarina BUZ 2]|uniref:DUF1735 domain-containing protein n=2 Tax=Fibrella TaxID=861914 RepID=I0K5X6_9BACT|nr:protein of unknown function DUF1735 [Fibrella aestuarina BUZ 2]
MTACLNDDAHFVDFTNTPAIVDVPSSAFYGAVENRGFPIQTTPNSYTFNVNLSGPNTLSEDVTVTMAVDPALLTQYNANNGTDYQLLPAALYQASGLTATIKAGQRLAGPITVNLYTDATRVPDPATYNDAGYALPLRITAVSNSNVAVSSNYGYKILVSKIKNQYDGTYQATGTFTHPVATSSRAINKEKTLVTVNTTTIETEFADLGASDWRMQLTVNADNTVTLKPVGASNTSTTQFGVNKYDPATRTYTLNYKYPGSGGDRVINETLKFEQ